MLTGFSNTAAAEAVQVVHEDLAIGERIQQRNERHRLRGGISRATCICNTHVNDRLHVDYETRSRL